jgi:hypothetical protein
MCHKQQRCAADACGHRQQLGGIGGRPIRLLECESGMWLSGVNDCIDTIVRDHPEVMGILGIFTDVLINEIRGRLAANNLLVVGPYLLTSRYRTEGGFSPNWIFSTATPQVVNFLTMRSILQKFHIRRLAIVAEELNLEKDVTSDYRAEAEAVRLLATSIGVDFLGTMWLHNSNDSWISHPDYQRCSPSDPRSCFS